VFSYFLTYCYYNYKLCEFTRFRLCLVIRTQIYPPTLFWHVWLNYVYKWKRSFRSSEFWLLGIWKSTECALKMIMFCCRELILNGRVGDWSRSKSFYIIAVFHFLISVLFWYEIISDCATLAGYMRTVDLHSIYPEIEAKGCSACHSTNVTCTSRVNWSNSFTLYVHVCVYNTQGQLLLILTSACCGSDKPRAFTSYILSSVSLHWIFLTPAMKGAYVSINHNP
jgi:hypothetical protein